ncbi:MAG: alanine racemase [Minisyncoccia bacterium]
MNSLSCIELSKKNLIHNIKQFRNLAKKGTKFSVAIKGNAYGHGQNLVAKILEPYVDYFQVDDIEELELLRRTSKKKTFLFGYAQKTDLARVTKLNCILTIFSLEQLKELNKIAEKSKIKQEIHIPVDAFLGREGFLLKDLPKIFIEIKKCKNIKLTGIYAHFANIEDTNNFTHAKKQITIFKQAVNLAKKFGFKNLQTHISATSGLLVYEKNKGLNSIIRLGIGVYGLWPSEHIKFLYKNKMELRPVMAWKTKIAQLKILPAGSTIGYGLSYMTYEETKIAVIPQGYADGLGREFSNKGEVLIAGTRCKILGRVAMNMCVADVTRLPEVKIEDGVVILGKQGNEEVTAEEMAERINTINYEITTRISSLLPRIVV